VAGVGRLRRYMPLLEDLVNFETRSS
jgi:hypothetical protein